MGKDEQADLRKGGGSFIKVGSEDGALALHLYLMYRRPGTSGV